MIWDILNVVLALFITATATFKLVWFYDDFKPTERVGLGIIAGSVLLTVPSLLDTSPTPFDDWSPAALRVGIAFYFVGKAERLLRHARNNRRQVSLWNAHVKRRGK